MSKDNQFLSNENTSFRSLLPKINSNDIQELKGLNPIGSLTRSDVSRSISNCDFNSFKPCGDMLKSMNELEFQFNKLSQPCLPNETNSYFLSPLPTPMEKNNKNIQSLPDFSSILDPLEKNKDGVPIWDGPLSPFTSFGTSKTGPQVLISLCQIMDTFVNLGLIDFKLFDFRMEGRFFHLGDMAGFIVEILATPTKSNPIHIEARRTDGDSFAFNIFTNKFFAYCEDIKLICRNFNTSQNLDLVQNYNMGIVPNMNLLCELLDNIIKGHCNVKKACVAMLTIHITDPEFQKLLAKTPNILEMLIQTLDISKDAQVTYGILKILNQLFPLTTPPRNCKKVLQNVSKEWKQCKVESYGSIQTIRIPSQQVVREVQSCLNVLELVATN